LLIRQQGERQLVFLPKFGMRVRRLRTDADHPHAGSLNLGVQVAEFAGLAGATRREIGGVEVEDDRARAQQFGQRSVGSGIVRKREFRRSFTRFQHAALSLAAILS
jgi:hypothetical protein